MKKFFITIFALAFITTLSYSQELLKTGDLAPDFTLPYATKDTIIFSGIKLSESVKSGKVILAFYPADWSGGCTKEVCSLRDNFNKLSDLNAQVLAISGDYVFSHKEWATHHNLPFKLLSDHDHAVAKKYSSYDEKRGFNKRTVFVVNEKGIITYLDYDYKVNDDKDFIELTKALK
jgi:peroxiredoxin Q/BCP